MSQSIPELRWAENEVYFRQRNKGAIDDLSEMKDTAKSEDQESILEDTGDDDLLFYCECANEDCHERIELTINEYEKHHKSPSRFIVKTGHNQPEIERIVAEGGTFVVVEKYIEPPQHVDKLNPTDL
jgi:hypothetical protein